MLLPNQTNDMAAMVSYATDLEYGRLFGWSKMSN